VLAAEGLRTLPRLELAQGGGLLCEGSCSFLPCPIASCSGAPPCHGSPGAGPRLQGRRVSGRACRSDLVRLWEDSKGADIRLLLRLVSFSFAKLVAELRRKAPRWRGKMFGLEDINKELVDLVRATCPLSYTTLILQLI